MAFNFTIHRRVFAVDSELEKGNNIDPSVQVTEPENNLLYITLPSILGKGCKTYRLD